VSAGETALWQRPAREVAALLAAGDIAPGEALDSAEARVAEVNPSVNALPTLAFAEARARAARGALPAPLHGLPVPIKDSVSTAGIRTTWGSTVFSGHVPARNDAVVDMLEARGALVCAKSNTPEFEAGAHTFNEVFGLTRNPWDLTRTAGGSSGGAAVAVATGMAWIAQGSDRSEERRVGKE